MGHYIDIPFFLSPNRREKRKKENYSLLTGSGGRGSRYMGGANQGKMGVAFGGRRQIIGPRNR